jgi:hypothetical protein
MDDKRTADEIKLDLMMGDPADRRLDGETQGVAYHEQVNALGAQGVALVETLKVIGEKGVRITPDVMATGGGAEGGGGIGSLLQLNLFRDRLNIPAPNGEKVTR